MKYLHRYRSLAALCSASLLTALMVAPASGGDEAKESKAVAAPAPSSPFHALFNLEIADKYVTPRGMIVRDRGVTIEPLLLLFLNVYKGAGFIDDVTLVAGAWNDFGTSAVSVHAPYGSHPRTNWTEVDPIGGISIGFAKHFKLDVTYTSFVERVLDIDTSHHLETKLSFDDSALLQAFALHPYASYWQELHGKATDADVPEAVFGPSPNSGKHPSPGSSFYFELGVAPSYTFKNLGDLKIEAPCRVLLPNSRFYGEYYKSASTVGLYELGMKASLPLNFIPATAGHWSVHAGFKYLNFVDDNLYHLNNFNDPGKDVRDTWQVYGGFSIFY